MRSLIVRNLNDICLKEYGGTKSRMAEALGVSQSKMSRILNEDQDGIDAYLDVASRVSSEHSIPLEQLTQPKPATPEAPTGAGKTKALRMYDVTVGAGNGKRPMNEWDFTELRIPTKILKSMVGRENVPKEVGITKVKGESMYPEVQSGDYVMWTATESVCDGGTYLIRLDGGLLLKVLQRKAGKRLRIHSINSSFSDDFIRQTESGVWVTDDEQEHMVDFEVVGRFLNVIQPKDLFRSTQRLHDVMSAYDKIENGDVPA